MLCTVPLSLKVLWSPIVEFWYSKSFGKRKTWVVGSQLVMCFILFYLRDIEQMLLMQEITKATILLTVLVFVITCQDIAVDSWAVEMLRPENASYGSSV